MSCLGLEEAINTAFLIHLTQLATVRFLKLILIKHLHGLYSIFIQVFPFLISYNFHCRRAEGSRDLTVLLESRRQSLPH